MNSLEPSSPFLWELAHKDAFLPPDQQFYVPSEVMATIIQGSRHYPKNLKSAVTRGDMRGTDGTVTISGASMRLLKYQMNLCGGSAADEVIIQKSTSEVALRLHPSHTHRSIIDSLLLKSDVFHLVRRALETTREQFRSLQQSFKEENEIFESPTHSPGNLLGSFFFLSLIFLSLSLSLSFPLPPPPFFFLFFPPPPPPHLPSLLSRYITPTSSPIPHSPTYWLPLLFLILISPSSFSSFPSLITSNWEGNQLKIISVYIIYKKRHDYFPFLMIKQ